MSGLRDWPFLALLLFLVLFAPQERELGKVAKLVYLHGAVVYSAFVLLCLSALAGIAGFLGPGRARRAADGFLRSALYLMALNMVLAPIVTRLTWGVYFQWSEPRFIVSYAMFAISFGLAVILSGLPGSRWSSLLYLLPAPLSVLLLGLGGRLIHPAGPVQNSDSVAIKAFFSLMVLVMTGWAVLTVYRKLRR